MLTEYQAGTINVTQGSQIVQGVGTSWLTYAQVGETIKIQGVDYIITGLSSINTMVIDRPYEGDTATQINYLIIKG